MLAIPHEHALMIRSRVLAGDLADEVGALVRSAALPLTEHLYQWTGSGPTR